MKVPSNRKIKTEHPRLIRILAVLFWLLVWQAAAMILNRPLLLSSPLRVAERLFALLGEGDFYRALGFSLRRIALGFALGLLCGTLLAVLAARIPLLEVLLRPLMATVKSVPVASFIILALLWLSARQLSAFISFLMVLPIIWTSVQEGLNATDARLIEMANAYRLTAFQKARYLYAPSVLPHFSAGCVTGLGFAWKSGIAAEVIAKPDFAIGSSLQDAKIYLETPTLFAWTALVILLSMVLERVLVIGMRKAGGGSKR